MMMSLVAKCQDFLNGYLEALDANVGKGHRNAQGKVDVAANFDRIGKKIVSANENDFVSPSTFVQASMKGKTRVITYRPMSTDIAYASNTLAELLHHSKEDSYYSDRQLDTGMRALIGDAAYDAAEKEYKAKHKGQYDIGMVAHSLVKKNCQ
jgi:hypothetical protein